MMFEPITWRARVRVYECDALGHVNNAIYLHYLQQATAEGWEAATAATWELRRLAVEYLSPLRDGDDLTVSALPDGYDARSGLPAYPGPHGAAGAGGERGLPACRYIFQHAADGRVAARAQAVWALLDRATREPSSLSEDWPAHAPESAETLAPFRLKADSLRARTFHWRHTVRHYEADGSGRANPAEIMHWLQEAKFDACAEAGWPLERIRAAGTVIVQVRHDTEWYDALAPGDQVEIVSWVYELHRVKGTWRQEIYRAGQMVVLDYSTGAFLNLMGRPSPPPQAILDALTGGAA